eukprot:m.46302 g.46302  ORF g.46302 m.46302 type:complete len:597 (+) comp10355_c0_seq1:240-2030(+)
MEDDSYIERMKILFAAAGPPTHNLSTVNEDFSYQHTLNRYLPPNDTTFGTQNHQERKQQYNLVSSSSASGSDDEYDDGKTFTKGRLSPEVAYQSMLGLYSDDSDDDIDIDKVTKSLHTPVLDMVSSEPSDLTDAMLRVFGVRDKWIKYSESLEAGAGEGGSSTRTTQSYSKNKSRTSGSNKSTLTNNEVPISSSSPFRDSVKHKKSAHLERSENIQASSSKKAAPGALFGQHTRKRAAVREARASQSPTKQSNLSPDHQEKCNTIEARSATTVLQTQSNSPQANNRDPLSPSRNTMKAHRVSPQRLTSSTNKRQTYSSPPRSSFTMDSGDTPHCQKSNPSSTMPPTPTNTSPEKTRVQKWISEKQDAYGKKHSPKTVRRWIQEKEEARRNAQEAELKRLEALQAAQANVIKEEEEKAERAERIFKKWLRDKQKKAADEKRRRKEEEARAKQQRLQEEEAIRSEAATRYKQWKKEKKELEQIEVAQAKAREKEEEEKKKQRAKEAEEAFKAWLKRPHNNAPTWRNENPWIAPEIPEDKKNRKKSKKKKQPTSRLLVQEKIIPKPKQPTIVSRREMIESRRNIRVPDKTKPFRKPAQR